MQYITFVLIYLNQLSNGSRLVDYCGMSVILGLDCEGFLLLLLFICGYCAYRVYRLQQTGQVSILLKPTKVLFSHKKEGETNEQLRTVVAYQNPFTGDYCVHKSRVPRGYMNTMESPDSPDSGVSDAYEPLNLVPQPRPTEDLPGLSSQTPEPIKTPMTPIYDNSVNKTWKWEYTEYQI